VKEINVKILNDYAGHDGNSYFCRRCGKAGFSSIMQVRGHLSACPSRSDVVVVSPPGPPPVKENFSGVLVPNERRGVGGETDMLQKLYAITTDLANRMERIERSFYNEIPHRLAVAQYQNNDFGWLKWILIALLVLWFFQKTGNSESVKNLAGKAGDRLLSKAVDKAMAGF